MRQAVGDGVAIRCPGTGPFALALYLIGTQNWLLEVGMVEAGMSDGQESALHRGLELAAEALIRFGIACWEAGADIIQCGDSLASCNVISPQTYRRFAWPYQQKVFRAWREHGIRASLLHICGDSSRVLDEYAETGADLIEIDNQVDLRYAAQRIGGRATLVGNVHTVTELLEGSRETVRAAAERCLCAAAGAALFWAPAAWSPAARRWTTSANWSKRPTASGATVRGVRIGLALVPSLPKFRWELTGASSVVGGVGRPDVVITATKRVTALYVASSKLSRSGR